MKLPPMTLHKLINVDPETDAVILSSPHRKLQVKLDPKLGGFGIFRDARSEYYQSVGVETETGKVKIYLVQAGVHLGNFAKSDGKILLIDYDNVETHASNVQLNYVENTLWLREAYDSQGVSKPPKQETYKWSDSLSAEEHFSG